MYETCQTLTIHRQICGIWVNTSMETHPWQHIHGMGCFTYLYTPPWVWHGCFADPAKSSPTDWLICGLVWQELSSFIVPQASRTFSMYRQDIWNGCSGNNTHHHDSGMMILQILPNLVTQLGYSVAWMDGISAHWLCHRLVRPCTCANKTCRIGGNTSMSYGFI